MQLYAKQETEGDGSKIAGGLTVLPKRVVVVVDSLLTVVGEEEG